MGRNRTHLELSAADRTEMQRRIRETTDARQRERLRLALWAGAGRHTLEDLALRAGRSRSTIQNWLCKFNRGGVEELMERATPPGSESPLGTQRIRVKIKAGLKSGRFRSAAQVAAWLQKEHGILRARKSLYYWFQKYGLETPHSRKSDNKER